MKRIQATEKNRFSTFVKSRNSEQYRDLEKWQKWFTGRGIPSVIICTRSGYALYREGLTEIDIHDDETPIFEMNQPKSFFGNSMAGGPTGIKAGDFAVPDRKGSARHV